MEDNEKKADQLGIIEQYLDSTKFMLEKLESMAVDAKVWPHADLWRALQTILFRINSTERFFKFFKVFSVGEIETLMIES